MVMKSLNNLAKSFKSAFANFTQYKLLAVLILVSIALIVLFSVKNGNIDLFIEAEPTTTSIAPEEPSDLLPAVTPAQTSAFDNYNFNFIKSYNAFKQQNSDYINQLKERAQTIDGLTTRVGNIINE